MAIDPSVPRTRRALLAGGIGGVVAIVASALGRPLPASAASAEFDSSDDATPAVKATHTWAGTGVLGSSHGGTGIVASSSGGTGLVASSVYGDGIAASTTGGTGLVASSGSGSAVVASSDSGDGVRASSASGSGVGVYGYSPATIGVWGTSFSGFGVQGESAEYCGVKGESTSGFGVYGYSDANYGVFGENGASGTPAIMGRSPGQSTGVLGYSGPNPLPVAPARTGVYGYAAQDATARGITGQSTAGRGVSGIATTGTGVYATATTGYALRAVGRVRFDRCTGVAPIAAGSDRVTVTPGIDLVSTSAVVATLQGNAGGTTTVHRCVVNTTANTFTIYLTKAATQNVKVAWHVFG